MKALLKVLSQQDPISPPLLHCDGQQLIATNHRVWAYQDTSYFPFPIPAFTTPTGLKLLKVLETFRHVSPTVSVTGDTIAIDFDGTHLTFPTIAEFPHFPDNPSFDIPQFGLFLSTLTYLPKAKSILWPEHVSGLRYEQGHLYYLDLALLYTITDHDFTLPDFDFTIPNSYRPFLFPHFHSARVSPQAVELYGDDSKLQFYHYQDETSFFAEEERQVLSQLAEGEVKRLNFQPQRGFAQRFRILAQNPTPIRIENGRFTIDQSNWREVVGTVPQDFPSLTTYAPAKLLDYYFHQCSNHHLTPTALLADHVQTKAAGQMIIAFLSGALETQLEEPEDEAETEEN